MVEVEEYLQWRRGARRAKVCFLPKTATHTIDAARSQRPPDEMERSPKLRQSLSAYNLFYRFKRFKILEAHDKAGGGEGVSKEAARRLIETQPGLEDYPSIASLMPVEQLCKLRRGEIRSAMVQSLMPADNDGRRHRKSHNSCILSFGEMNEVMGSSWKAIDDFGRSVFEDLAEEGCEEHRRLVAKSHREVEATQLPQEETKSNNPIAAPEETKGEIPTHGSSLLLSPAYVSEHHEKEIATSTVENQPTSSSASAITPQKSKLPPRSNKIASDRELPAKQEGRSAPEEMTMTAELQTALSPKSITLISDAPSSAAHGSSWGHSAAAFPTSSADASGPKDPRDTSPPKSTKEAKPKRALTAYNLFFRYKRGKILEMLDNNPSCSRESIIKLIGAPPGFEDYPSIAGIMPPEQAKELRRVEISTALAGDSLSPNRVKNRNHRMVKGPVSFLEANKAISKSWKEIDDFSKSVFENLAEEGRMMRQKRVAELEGRSAAKKHRVSPDPVVVFTPVPSRPGAAENGHAGYPRAVELPRVPCDAAVHKVTPAAKKLGEAQLHEPASPVHINPFDSGPSGSRAPENGHIGRPLAAQMPPPLCCISHDGLCTSQEETGKDRDGDDHESLGASIYGSSQIAKARAETAAARNAMTEESPSVDSKVEPEPLVVSTRVGERASPVHTNPFNSSRTPENGHSGRPVSVELPQSPNRTAARSTARGRHPKDSSLTATPSASISDYLNNADYDVEPEPLTFCTGFAELAEPSSDTEMSFNELSFGDLSLDALITDSRDAVSSSSTAKLMEHGSEEQEVDDFMKLINSLER